MTIDPIFEAVGPMRLQGVVNNNGLIRRWGIHSFARYSVPSVILALRDSFHGRDQQLARQGHDHPLVHVARVANHTGQAVLTRSNSQSSISTLRFRDQR